MARTLHIEQAPSSFLPHYSTSLGRLQERREITRAAGCLKQVKRSSDRAILWEAEPARACFAHLGVNFITLPEFMRLLAKARARDRAIDVSHVLALGRKGARRRSIASSHPDPSGTPQTGNGTTAIFFGGEDIENAATAATAAAPPPHRRTAVGLV